MEQDIRDYKFGYVVFYRRNGEPTQPYALCLGQTTIGSNGECDIRLKKDDRLEPRHCTIEVEESGLATIINLSEANPVVVSGKEIQSSTLLRHEDTIEILQKKFLYCNETLTLTDITNTPIPEISVPKGRNTVHCIQIKSPILRTKTPVKLKTPGRNSKGPVLKTPTPSKIKNKNTSILSSARKTGSAKSTRKKSNLDFEDTVATSAEKRPDVTNLTPKALIPSEKAKTASKVIVSKALGASHQSNAKKRLSLGSASQVRNSPMKLISSKNISMSAAIHDLHTPKNSPMKKRQTPKSAKNSLIKKVLTSKNIEKSTPLKTPILTPNEQTNKLLTPKNSPTKKGQTPKSAKNSLIKNVLTPKNIDKSTPSKTPILTPNERPKRTPKTPAKYQDSIIDFVFMNKSNTGNMTPSKIDNSNYSAMKFNNQSTPKDHTTMNVFKTPTSMLKSAKSCKSLITIDESIIDGTLEESTPKNFRTSRKALNTNDSSVICLSDTISVINLDSTTPGSNTTTKNQSVNKSKQLKTVISDSESFYEDEEIFMSSQDVSRFSEMFTNSKNISANDSNRRSIKDSTDICAEKMQTHQDRTSKRLSTKKSIINEITPQNSKHSINITADLNKSYKNTPVTKNDSALLQTPQDRSSKRLSTKKSIINEIIPQNSKHSINVTADLNKSHKNTPVTKNDSSLLQTPQDRSSKRLSTKKSIVNEITPQNSKHSINITADLNKSHKNTPVTKNDSSLLQTPQDRSSKRLSTKKSIVNEITPQNSKHSINITADLNKSHKNTPGTKNDSSLLQTPQDRSSKRLSTKKSIINEITPQNSKHSINISAGLYESQKNTPITKNHSSLLMPGNSSITTSNNEIDLELEKSHGNKSLKRLSKTPVQSISFVEIDTKVTPQNNSRASKSFRKLQESVTLKNDGRISRLSNSEAIEDIFNEKSSIFNSPSPMTGRLSRSSNRSSQETVYPSDTETSLQGSTSSSKSKSLVSNNSTQYSRFSRRLSKSLSQESFGSYSDTSTSSSKKNNSLINDQNVSSTSDDTGVSSRSLRTSLINTSSTSSTSSFNLDDSDINDSPKCISKCVNVTPKNKISADEGFKTPLNTPAIFEKLKNSAIKSRNLNNSLRKSAGLLAMSNKNQEKSVHKKGIKRLRDSSTPMSVLRAGKKQKVEIQQDVNQSLNFNSTLNSDYISDLEDNSFNLDYSVISTQSITELEKKPLILSAANKRPASLPIKRSTTDSFDTLTTRTNRSRRSLLVLTKGTISSDSSTVSQASTSDSQISDVPSFDQNTSFESLNYSVYSKKRTSKGTPKTPKSLLKKGAISSDSTISDDCISTSDLQLSGVPSFHHNGSFASINDTVNSKYKRTSKGTPKTPKSLLNDRSDVSEVKNLLHTPKINTPQTDISDIRGLKKLLSNPKEVKSPKNDLTDVKGLKKLMQTPKEIKEPKNDLTNIIGVKKLLQTPKQQNSPKNDLTKISGLKRLLRTPKAVKSPKNDLTNVAGVKKLLSTPKVVKSPKNDLTNVAGVKRLLRTPKVVKSPKNDLTNIAGLKKLMGTPKQMKSPRNDLTDVGGIKKLFSTPKELKSPRNDLSNVSGVKKLLGTPKETKSPHNDLSDLRGVKSIFRTPKQKEPVNELEDLEGVSELFQHELYDLENADLFSALFDKKPIRQYRPKSTTPNKTVKDNCTNRKTLGDLPINSPEVAKWVEAQSSYLQIDKDLPENVFELPKTKSPEKILTNSSVEKSSTRSRRKIAETGSETESNVIEESKENTPVGRSRRGAANKIEIQSKPTRSRRGFANKNDEELTSIDKYTEDDTNKNRRRDKKKLDEVGTHTEEQVQSVPKRRGRPLKTKESSDEVSTEQKTELVQSVPNKRGRVKKNTDQIYSELENKLVQLESDLVSKIEESSSEVSTEQTAKIVQSVPKRRGRIVKTKESSNEVSIEQTAKVVQSLPNRRGRVKKNEENNDKVSSEQETKLVQSLPNRNGRVSKTEESSSEVSTEQTAELVQSVPTRRGRVKKNEESTDEVFTELPTRNRRGNAVDRDENAMNKPTPENLPDKPKGRSRKVTAKCIPEVDIENTLITPVSKRTRRGKKETPIIVDELTNVSEKEKKSPIKTRRGKKGTPLIVDNLIEDSKKEEVKSPAKTGRGRRGIQKDVQEDTDVITKKKVRFENNVLLEEDDVMTAPNSPVKGKANPKTRGKNKEIVKESLPLETKNTRRKNVKEYDGESRVQVLSVTTKIDAAELEDVVKPKKGKSAATKKEEPAELILKRTRTQDNEEGPKPKRGKSTVSKKEETVETKRSTRARGK